MVSWRMGDTLMKFHDVGRLAAPNGISGLCGVHKCQRIHFLINRAMSGISWDERSVFYSNTERTLQQLRPTMDGS